MKPHIQFHRPQNPLFFETLLVLQSIAMVTKLTMDCQYSSESWRLKQGSGPSWRHNFAREDSQEWQQYGTMVPCNKLLQSTPYGFRGTLSKRIYIFTFTASNSNTGLIRCCFWTLHLHMQGKWRYGTYPSNAPTYIYIYIYKIVKRVSACTVQRISAFTRCAGKSLARPGRKQSIATEDFDVHIPYL